MSRSNSVSINMLDHPISPLDKSMSHYSPSHHSMSHHSNHSRDVELELGPGGPVEDPQAPTRVSTTKTTIMGLYEDFSERFPNWDLYMVFELFVFMMSFFFLVGESGDTDFRGPDSSYLYQINTVFMIDFLFRLLSINIDSIKREYWNHVLHCILPLIMFLLAAFYKFDNVFGSEPIKVLNAMLFTMVNFVVLVVIIMKVLTLEKVKELFKKKEDHNIENNSENIV